MIRALNAENFRLWPDSLRRQTLVGTILIVILTQILTIILMIILIFRPQMERNVQMMARNVAFLTQSVSAVPEADRPALINGFKASPYIDLWVGETPPDRSGPPPRAIEILMMRALARELKAQDNELVWRTDMKRKLWLEVYIGRDAYWISFKSIPYQRANGLLIILALVAVFFGSIMASRLNSKILTPLNQLRQATDKLSINASPPWLSEDGPREITALSRAFNRMSARIRRSDHERAIVLAGISHDVRTPLTKLRLTLEMMEVKDLSLKADSERYVDQIDRILSNFMMFARGFEAEPVRAVKINEWLSLLGADYGEIVLKPAPLPTDFSLDIRPDALRRALNNLIENAINYGRSPIVLTATKAANCFIISLRDHGDGVDPTMLARLTEPFVRAEPVKSGHILPSGTGLGLALVDKIARLHQGTLELVNHSDGFEARLILPVKPVV
jgi:two-component system osmolarity sensor histidine kinase EnvZ